MKDALPLLAGFGLFVGAVYLTFIAALVLTERRPAQQADSRPNITVNVQIDGRSLTVGDPSGLQPWERGQPALPAFQSPYYEALPSMPAMPAFRQPEARIYMPRFRNAPLALPAGMDVDALRQLASGEEDTERY